jgi:Uma2 family endonuclease
MASILDKPEAIEAADQTGFNLAVWDKVLHDEFLASVPHRIETDRYGQIVMSPPPAPEHGEEQFEIGALIKKLLPAGHIITECPVSTSDGVKAVDVAWISKPRRAKQKGKICLTEAPEICVEVISPRNTRRELNDKKALFFAAGAEEVWFCQQGGRMEFFLKGEPQIARSSNWCPGFPANVTID